MKGQSLESLIDQYMVLEEERKVLQKRADEKKNEVDRFYNEIVVQMSQGEHIAQGTHTRVYLYENQEPKADDWHEIYSHIRKTGEFELLHKRLTASAIKERWDANVEVPGVVRYPVFKLQFKPKV